MALKGDGGDSYAKELEKVIVSLGETTDRLNWSDLHEEWLT